MIRDAPAFDNSCAQELIVAPVVTTGSQKTSELLFVAEGAELLQGTASQSS
jgi:hypothetical protein